MSIQQEKVLRLFSPKRIIIPILIGLAVVTYFFISGFDKEVYKSIEWTWNVGIWMFLALVMIGIRQLAYMYRIKLLSNGALTWRQSFDVIMVWEFASAVTPSIIGGAAAALFILNNEGINMGRTTTIVLFTTFLDELFFILCARHHWGNLRSRWMRRCLPLRRLTQTAFWLIPMIGEAEEFCSNFSAVRGDLTAALSYSASKK